MKTKKSKKIFLQRAKGAGPLGRLLCLANVFGVHLQASEVYSLFGVHEDFKVRIRAGSEKNEEEEAKALLDFKEFIRGSYE